MSNHFLARVRPVALALLFALFVASCSSSSDMNHGASPTSAAPVSTAAPGAANTTADAMAGMDHGGMEMTPVVGDGTAPAAAGYTLAVKSQLVVGANKLTFVINGPQGSPITDAVVEQTKKLHLIIARSDLTGYQHVHPEVASDGLWSVPVTLTAGGTYRVIADLTPVEGTRVVLGAELVADGAGQDRPLPAPANTTNVDQYQVVMSGSLMAKASTVQFVISKDGTPASDVTEYLGAGGHLVALKEGTLAYTHLHPNGTAGAKLTFESDAMAAGSYRLFLQFATGSQVHTAEFTAVVA